MDKDTEPRARRYGEGRVFQRRGRWWIAYCWNRREVRESARTTDWRVAEKFLDFRLEEIMSGTYHGRFIARASLERVPQAGHVRKGVQQ